MGIRADSRLAPNQWETSLQSNAVSHWLGTNLESALGDSHSYPFNRDAIYSQDNMFILNWSPLVSSIVVIVMDILSHKSHAPGHNPSGAEARIFWDSSVNTMATDTCPGSGASAKMVLSMQDKWGYRWRSILAKILRHLYTHLFCIASKY